jgi:hypothetical protein
MSKRHYTTKLWITIALLGCGLAIIALAGQLVSAQQSEYELKPPFKLVEQSAAPEAVIPPPGSTVLLTETFGPAFNPTTVLSGTTPLWRVFTNPDDTAGYYWDRVGSGTYANSAWSAADPTGLTPGVSPYPAGQDTWLIYGPIDLGKFAYGHLSFEYYLDSRGGDTLSWGYSTDGQNFFSNSQSGALSRWITDTFAFPSKAVYVAFAFSSQANPQGIGAFIRNVKLTAEPLKYSYLPMALSNYSPPTPTPIPPLFGYTFNAGNSDLAEWGGAFYNTGNTKYGQCIPGECTMHSTTPHGNPANSLRLFTNGLYSFIASSPNDIAPDNFDLYVDLSPWVIYPRDASCVLFGCPDNDLGDWYGVIFNASNDTFGSNPSQFAYNKTYYRLYFYNIDATKPIALRLDRCDGAASSSANSCHKLAVSSLPSNFIGNASGFDTLRIQRLASGSIQISLNGTLLISVTDATYTGSSHGKYGVFIFSWTQNATQNPPNGYEMQVDFDNIKVYQR